MRRTRPIVPVPQPHDKGDPEDPPAEPEPFTPIPTLRGAVEATSSLGLSEDHRRTLEAGSGIAPDLIDGVRTVENGRDLPPGYSGRQRRRGRGMLFEGTRPNGDMFTVYRPDAPDLDNPGLKYECEPKRRGGPGNVLYVHPSQRHLIPDTSVPVVYTEGMKKALSLLSAVRAAGDEVLVVGLLGTWNWMADGKPIPDMHEIPVEERDTVVWYDSDVLSNPGVQLAASRLAEHLTSRGARVGMTYTRDQPDGSKTGADDFLAAGGTLSEAEALTRPYDPDDLAAARISRDGELREAVGQLRHRWRDQDWMRFVGAADRGNWARGHTARDVMDALIRLAPKNGKVEDRGVLIRGVGTRRLAELAAKSAPSVAHALKHLEAEGIVEILPAEDRGKARGYRLLVPRAALYSTGRGYAEGTDYEEGEEKCKGLRAPSAHRLRWSSPGRSRRREFELVPGRVVVRHGGRTPAVAVGEDLEARHHVKRLGPHRCAVLDALEAAGGELTLAALCETLHRRRPRDVRRRILPMLEDAGIVACEGDAVRLASDWLGRLEEERERKGEISQAERQAEKHRKERDCYREHLERQRRGTPEASRAAVRRTHDLRERRLRGLRDEDERDRAPTPPAVEALIARILGMHDRMRVGLLCEIAKEEGLRWRDVPPALRRMGYRVERLPEFGDVEFVYPDRRAA